MTRKVAVVTDSTAYIPVDQVEKWSIRVAPQILIWGDQTYLDGVTIQPSEFYQRLQTANTMPSTSQVTPAALFEIFSELHESQRDIIAILISEKLSGTIASAIQARDMLPDARIEIVDSRATSMAMGFHVLSVVRAAHEGASIDDCVAIAKKAREHTGVFLTVETLDYLHRGGRIGGGTRFLGTALNIKVILALRDGRLEGLERIRTRRKSLQRLLELTKDTIGEKQPVRIASIHANANAEAKELLSKAEKALNPVEVVLSDVSPVVGTHIGPGTIGLAFMAGM